MTRFYIKAKTALALGLPNLVRAVAYRLSLKFGFNPVLRLRAPLPVGPFYLDASYAEKRLPLSRQWQSEALYFGWWANPVTDFPPDWHLNPFTGGRVAMPERVWWQIPDFDQAAGDIKIIWEASRFDWVLAFAQRAKSGETAEIQRLNAWLADWCLNSPPYCGPNWKCGQEASIRVMHLAMASLILGQTEAPAKGLIDLIKLHLLRIVPTVSYAMAQDNNHGTSEAAALFIGGSWLDRLGIKGGERWQRTGRKWLENRAARLIEADGSFSQYSLNYHRLMLDTFSMVEVWRRHLGLPEFSELLLSRVKAATRLLFAMVDPRSGDAPNLGANDGARLLPLTDTDYRDFRPSVQLAMALFTGERAYADDGPWNAQLAWLGVDLPEKVAAQIGSHIFDDGGYGLLKRGDVMALMRYPRFRFRPSQADALHVDLWRGGENLLRDAGTFSYNTAPELLTYFPGTVSHNTIQFDDRDQMPRLSRFLFGDWLKTECLHPLLEKVEETSFGAAYRDGQGAFHQRTLWLSDDRLIVRDEVSGFTSRAVLRWRVRPGNWILDEQTLVNGENSLSVTASVPVSRLEVVDGWESRYYLQKTPTPVLEVEIRQPGVLITEYCWNI